ncbi:site-2 protease family protein [Natroniella sp. ANB-PHB2]|uniref:site-2 protease family protein n=1 Tax=Natroniella sp. ANB-PHB2 TaxID=3384444 RepID=UPI0038D44D21
MDMAAELILLLPVLLLSLSLHEYAHGKMADLLGDPTPKMTGRLTLNPMAHLSLIGTLVLIMTRRFGWAKPVQVNPSYFDDKRKGMMLVGLAGPLANVSLAIVFTFFFRSLGPVLYQFIDRIIIERLFINGILINLGLAIFNSIPVPPLDGSKILRGLIPRKYDYIFRNLEAYGPFVLLFAVFTGLIGRIILPIINILFNLLMRI